MHPEGVALVGEQFLVGLERRDGHPVEGETAARSGTPQAAYRSSPLARQ